MEEDDYITFSNSDTDLQNEVYEKVTSKGIKFFIDRINAEEYLIPSFQREFVWNKDDVVSLLNSLFRGYPIGSLLLCPINDYTKKFYKPKNFRYVEKNVSMGYIVLDGQQRLTALYRAFTKDYDVSPDQDEDKFYLYYLQIEIKDDSESLNRQCIRIKISSTEKKEIPIAEENHFNLPLHLLYNQGSLDSWIDEFSQDYSKKTGKKESLIFKRAHQLFSLTSTSIFARLNNDLIPFIILTSGASNDIKRVCDMFDKLNDSGIGLDEFDKISARLYPKDIDLRKIWHDILKENKELRQFKIPPIDVIRTMSLIDQENKSNEEFSVQLKYIKSYMDEFDNEQTIRQKFMEAGSFFNQAIQHLKKNQGMISKKWIPRDPVLIVFAAVWYFIEKKDRILRAKLLSNLEKWYWCNVFDTKFDGSTIGPIAEEFYKMLDWIDNESDIPKTVSQFRKPDLMDVNRENNAIFRGVMCLLIKKGIIDFFDGRKIEDYPDELDDHHIYPVDYLQNTLSINSERKINCVINRTLIHKSTNRSKIIGNIPPRSYLSDIKQNIGDRFKELCDVHLLDCDLNSRIYLNYFKFLKFRKEKIMELILQSVSSIR